MKKPYHGLIARNTRARREYLVKAKKASWFLPYRTLEQTIAAAGL